MTPPERVRVVMSAPPTPGAVVNGVLLGRDAQTITVRDRKGAELVIPWTSISVMITNPKEAEA